ncbi:HAD-IA family hydrolase [Roseobacter sp. HKCCA0434]|uniref:HAD-IA family hydrolase n=1 Tax=Roseobacter sp. HKCCA0434 TaxID=3079297 RepID=UPI002905B94D|nr:HAD-IA family hydrolase [Roseobacter sp. HKCCA0434]
MRLVFDLDETLVDSVPSLAAAANRMLAELERGPVTPETYKHFVGHGMRQQVKRVLEATGGIPGGDLRPHLARMIEIYGADPVTGTEPFDCVRETLDMLAAEGHGLAVCTQKPEAQARTLLAGLALMPPVTGLTGGDTLDVLKPDPAMLRHAASQLPGDAPIVMVGDRDVDAQTAAAADVPFLHFAPTGETLTEPVAARFAHWRDFPAALASLSLAA